MEKLIFSLWYNWNTNMLIFLLCMVAFIQIVTVSSQQTGDGSACECSPTVVVKAPECNNTSKVILCTVFLLYIYIFFLLHTRHTLIQSMRIWYYQNQLVLYIASRKGDVSRSDVFELCIHICCKWLHSDVMSRIISQKCIIINSKHLHNVLTKYIIDKL